MFKVITAYTQRADPGLIICVFWGLTRRHFWKEEQETMKFD